MLNKDELEKWKIKNLKLKNYPQFDHKNVFNQKNILDYITNPNCIANHSFYPFLHTQIIMKKYHKNKGKYKKIRDIYFSSHRDRLIFSYYSLILNNLYNTYVKEEGIDKNILGYRNILSNNNNINFAKIIFDKIRKFDSCFILVGDFSNFFDNLDHQHLKKSLLKILGVDSLPEDWYNIYKNISKYSYCNLNDILKIKNTSLKSLYLESRIFNNKEFHQLKKEKKLKIYKNNLNVGIPQGNSLSAVLSNVFMSEFDKSLVDYLKEYNGEYYRYSDDFIIIIPYSEEKILENFKNKFNTLINSFSNLNLQEEKTKMYKYQDKKIIGKNSYINYLGFSFDGKNIFIRDKTTGKFYYRLYRKLKTIKRNNWYTKKGNKISCKNLYKHYSIRGDYISDTHKGNFFSYVNHCLNIFDKKESKKIKHIKNINLIKIRKFLNKIEDV